MLTQKISFEENMLYKRQEDNMGVAILKLPHQYAVLFKFNFILHKINHQ